MSIETDILDRVITSHGISNADLRDAFDGEYTSRQISNAMTRLRGSGQVELIDGLNFATSDVTSKTPAVKLPPAPVKVKTSQPAEACTDVGDETEHVGAGPDTNQPKPPAGSREHLARQIRAALGPHNNQDDSVTKCVTNLVDDHASQVHENQSLYALIAKIRDAAGDSEGKFMQYELVEHIKQLHQDAIEARAIRDYFSGFGETRPLIEIVKKLQEAPHQVQNDQPQPDYQTALHMMQSLLGDSYDELALHITYDTASVLAFGREFMLPHSQNEEIIQFMNSVGWMTGQELVEAA